MLGEGFLRVLRYREDRSSAEGEAPAKTPERAGGGRRGRDPAEAHNQPRQTGFPPVPNTTAPSGLLIPGCPTSPAPDPVLLDSFKCSLLEQYPDLQVADSGPLPPRRSATPQPLASPPIIIPTPPDPASDEGYLVMGSSVNVSADIPELRTNSMLNGMLERKLGEVYLQHLTENLARCNSHFGNSLLHGLVPPPQSDSPAPDSLVVSVEEKTTPRDKTLGYFKTTSEVPCSSVFSSPMLRISEGQE